MEKGGKDFSFVMGLEREDFHVFLLTENIENKLD